MKLVNTTQHAIDIYCPETGVIEKLPPAQVPTSLPSTGGRELSVLESQFGRLNTIRSSEFGKLQNFPAPQEGVIYFCSLLVFKAALAEGRTDICCGDNSKGESTSPFRWEKDDPEVIQGLQREGMVKAITTLIVP